MHARADAYSSWAAAEASKQAVQARQASRQGGRKSQLLRQPRFGQTTGYRLATSVRFETVKC